MSATTSSPRRRAGPRRGPKQATSPLPKKQLALIHIYKHAARIPDHQYRDILRRHAGVASAGDYRITQSGFEHAMAALEALLFARVERGEIPNPIGINRWIRREDYWRRKLPQRGQINSRQYHHVRKLWALLCDVLPPGKDTDAYFGGIVSQATGRRALGASALTTIEAGWVIDALKDRLAYCLRRPSEREP